MSQKRKGTARFTFSRHALEQMKLRNISANNANAILENPDKVIKETGKAVFQSIVTEKNRQYLIRIL